jgi:Mn2+/Fe2+ NRAMP family transporter
VCATPAGLVIPRLPRSALQMAVAIVGAGIMPANFYLHSALVHSRRALLNDNAQRSCEERKAVHVDK